MGAGPQEQRGAAAKQELQGWPVQGLAPRNLTMEKVVPEVQGGKQGGQQKARAAMP